MVEWESKSSCTDQGISKVDELSMCVPKHSSRWECDGGGGRQNLPSSTILRSMRVWRTTGTLATTGSPTGRGLDVGPWKTEDRTVSSKKELKYHWVKNFYQKLHSFGKILPDLSNIPDQGKVSVRKNGGLSLGWFNQSILKWKDFGVWGVKGTKSRKGIDKGVMVMSDRIFQ